MRIKAVCLCESRNEYVSGKGVVVKQRILQLHDCEPHNGQRIASSFEYVMTEEEKSQHSVGSLEGKTLEIGVSGFDVHNGKLRVRGALPPAVVEAVGKKA